MAVSKRGISKVGISAPRVITGVGYVILSREQEPEQYIRNCFRNNCLTIITDQGEVIKNCFVNIEVWNHIKFPKTIKDRGSLVVWVNIPYQNKAIIVGVLNKKDELNNIQVKNSFGFQRESNEGVGVVIDGNGDTGTLTFLTYGDDTDRGEIYIKALNKKQMAFLQMYVQGNMEIEVDKNLDFKIGNEIDIIIKDEKNNKNQASINYTIGKGFELIDEFNNNITTNKDSIQIKAAKGNKIYLKTDGDKETESALLGDKVENLFEEIKRLLQSMTDIFESSSASTYVLGPSVQAGTKLWKNNLLLMERKLKLIKSKNVELK